MVVVALEGVGGSAFCLILFLCLFDGSIVSASCNINFFHTTTLSLVSLTLDKADTKNASKRGKSLLYRDLTQHKPLPTDTLAQMHKTTSKS